MSKLLYINENFEQNIISNYLTEAFTPKTEQVLRVKQHLDDNFKVDYSQMDVDSSGKGFIVPTFIQYMNGTNRPMQTMTAATLLTYLDSHFNKLISNDEDRKKFLKQVITDWYNKKIGDNGVLSVNQIR